MRSVSQQTLPWQATIIASWEESSQGIVAVDDVRLHDGLCEHSPQDPDALHDFEESGSDFVLIDGSHLDWDTMSVGEQPDHSLGTNKGEPRLWSRGQQCCANI